MRKARLQLPSHILDDKDVPLRMLGMLACAIPRSFVGRQPFSGGGLLLRYLWLEDVDRHQHARLEAAIEQVEIEEDLISREGLVNRDGALPTGAGVGLIATLGAQGGVARDGIGRAWELD